MAGAGWFVDWALAQMPHARLSSSASKSPRYTVSNLSFILSAGHNLYDFQPVPSLELSVRELRRRDRFSVMFNDDTAR